MANDASQPRRVTYAPLDRCVACGYSLRGLRKLQCPECGADYTEEIVLIGDPQDRSKGQTSDRGAPAPNPIYIALEGVVFAGAVILAVVARTRGDAIGVSLAVFFALVVAAFTLRRLMRIRSATDEQGRYDADQHFAAILRMRPTGFAFRVGYGEFRFKPWSRSYRVRLRVSGDGDTLTVMFYRYARRIPLWRSFGIKVPMHLIDFYALRRALREFLERDGDSECESVEK